MNSTQFVELKNMMKMTSIETKTRKSIKKKSSKANEIRETKLIKRNK